jgi:hypothetical protein
MFPITADDMLRDVTGDEIEMDAVATLVRETLLTNDPCLELIAGTYSAWTGAFLISATGERVRQVVRRIVEALDDLTDALEAHLVACTRSTGEADPAVQAAYTALREAASRYDDLLFTLLDEVTPWTLDGEASGSQNSWAS